MSVAKRKLAVFSIMQFEPVWLPVWRRHYTAHAWNEDTYILHHELPRHLRANVRCDLPGGPVDYADWRHMLHDAASCGINVVPVHRIHSFSHEWLRDTVQQFFAFLLQSYDWVLFAEADEFVMPNPETHGIPLSGYVGSVLAKSGVPAVRTTGYEVVHKIDGADTERPLDLDNTPLLEQRRWWYPSELYSKTTLASVPMSWDIGFHRPCDMRISVPSQKCDDLLLVHMHKADFGVAVARAAEAARRNWDPHDVEKNFGYQNRIDNEEKMRAYFAMNIDTMNSPAELVPIPEAVREAL